MRFMLLLALCTVLLAGRSAAISQDGGADAAVESYHLSKVLDLPFDDAKEVVVAGLKERGFPILTEIKFHERVKAAIGRDVPRTEILGACAAKHAILIYDLDPHVPALLPCNVVLRDLGDGRTEVTIRNPRGLAMADPRFAAVGETVHAIMTDLLASL